MGWKKWLLIIPGMFILFGGSVLLGWSILQISNQSDTVAADAGSSVTQEKEEFSKEVINTPVSEEIMVLDSGEKGHDFISEVHAFYDETLTWGRIDTANYEEQKEKAESIIETLTHIKEVKNEELNTDFKNIQTLAETVVKSDDREAMRKLHRYFHDLDIILHGYNYDDTFQITKFRGENKTNSSE
ncbi:hypothetical protein [Robertmurraya kyonggiensis]|uniref:Uncharacterized protein n=1 Tax=Robertmurraya kyonggiensis TaxID=1037680 RepID=A0A4V5P153_9BACI|nr:hypothetical protein [Robertmurraya kyonggiensis]TKC16970.1 hypothetical protein FA727_12970 [Robertmurraya kyonggiensis]